MKYNCEIEINLARQKVIELFDSTENMYKWQEGLLEHEYLEGTPVEVGSKMRLKYKMGKREIKMIETITKRDLPDHFNGTYEADGVFNVVNNQFIEVDAGRTKMVSHCEFEMKSFLMKMFAFFMPGMFKKQSMKYLVDFKNFAETGKSVNN